MRWLLARLKEASTWRGIIWMLAAFGLSLRPDQAEAIVMAGMALAGLFGVFLPDESKKTRNELPPIVLQGRSESANADSGIGAMQSTDRVRVPPVDEQSQSGFRFGHTAWLDKPPGFNDRD